MFFVVAVALVVHLIFKRSETHEPVHLCILLVGVPMLLTFPLAEHVAGMMSSRVTTLSTFYITLSASILIYRLSPWHPLAKFPGPLVCRISKLWMAFLSLRGRQHIYYLQLHEKYGNVVRIGPNELIIRDVKVVAPMMGPQGLQKGPFWDGRVPEGETTKPMIAIRDTAEHARRRRPWAHAFSTAALKDYEKIITKRSVQFTESVGREIGAVDMMKWIAFFAYDVMTDLAFGGGTEMMRDGDTDGLWHQLEAGQKNAIFMSHVPWLGSLFLRFPGLAKDLKAWRAHAKKCAIERKKRDATRKDIFHHLMDQDGKLINPSKATEVVSDGGLAILAGSDTTSTAITNLIYLLLNHPKAYKRLQAEIDASGDNASDYTMQTRLPYLTATLNESLRLFPPILSGSQRYTEIGTPLGPYYVPKGTGVSVPFYSLHRDPKYFSPLPDSFVPERWLSAEEQAMLEPEIFKDPSITVLNAEAFIPFSLGPTNCVGKNLAWMEMRMIVCLLMLRYEMRLEEGNDVDRWEEEIRDYFVMIKGRLPVILTPRI